MNLKMGDESVATVIDSLAEDLKEVTKDIANESRSIKLFIKSNFPGHKSFVALKRQKLHKMIMKLKNIRTALNFAKANNDSQEEVNHMIDWFNHSTAPV